MAVQNNQVLVEDADAYDIPCVAESEEEQSDMCDYDKINTNRKTVTTRRISLPMQGAVISSVQGWGVLEDPEAEGELSSPSARPATSKSLTRRVSMKGYQ